MASKNLAQGESIEVSMAGKSGCAMMSTAAATSATAVFVLEAKSETGDWLTPVTMKNPLANPTVEQANLTGASKLGWVDILGAVAVRARRTDATGGNGTVTLQTVTKG